MISKGIFQQENTPQFLFNLIYGLVCTSAIFSGEYAGILMGLAYLQFLTISKHREIDWVVRVCTFGLMLSLLATLILLIIHWDVIQAGNGFPSETLKSVAWFGIVFMVIDAVRFQVRYYNIDILNFAKFLLILAICIVPAKLVYFSIFFDVPFADYFQFKINREIAFLDLNPNYADDVLVAHIMIIAWAIAVLRTNLLENKLLTFAALITVAFLTFHFTGANSRAALLGVTFSIVILFFISFRHLSKTALLGVLAVIVVIIFLASDRLSERMVQTAGQIEFITKFNDAGEANADELAQIAALKAVIDDIYANTPKDQSISATIAKECRPRLVNMSGQASSDNLPPSFRYLLFQDAVKMWSIHPYFGYGAYDKKTIMAKNIDINPCRTAYFTNVHNHYLDIVIRGGFFALIVFTALSLILFYLIWLSLKNKDSNWLMPLPVLAYFPYLYAQNLADVSFHKKAELTAILFTMAILLAINLTKHKRST